MVCRRVITWLLALMIALTFTPPAYTEDAPASQISGDQSGVTLRICFWNSVFNGLSTVLDEFYEETGISVEAIPVPADGGWAGYFGKLQAMIAANDIPDLIYIAIEGFQIFQKSGLIMPMEPFFEKFPDALPILNDLHPNIIAPYYADDQLWALTFEWNNVVTHINTNILNERGLSMPDEDWTWDEFVDMAKQMTYINDEGQQVYGVAVPDYYFALDSFLFSNNASILNEDWTEAMIDSPEAIEVMQKMYDLIYVHKVAPIPPVNAQNAFINDQIGMHFAGAWPLGGYYESGFREFDVQYPPKFQEKTIVLGGGLFLIMKDSQHQDEAFQLMLKMCSPEAQSEVLGKGAIPSSIKAADAAVLTDDYPPNGIIYRTTADFAIPVESPPEYAEVQMIFDRYISLIYADEMPVDEALRAAAAEINSILGM